MIALRPGSPAQATATPIGADCDSSATACATLMGARVTEMVSAGTTTEFAAVLVAAVPVAAAAVFVAAALPNLAKIGFQRANMVENSSRANNACSAVAFGCGTQADCCRSTGTSRRNSIRPALRITRSRASCNEARSFGVWSSAASNTACRVPY